MTRKSTNLASRAATARAGKYVRSLNGKGDADTLIRQGSHPGHTLYEFVQAHLPHSRRALASKINKWLYSVRHANGQSAFYAKHCQWLLKWRYEPDASLYAVMQCLVTETIRRGTGEFFLSKSQIADRTGLSPHTVARACKSLEKRGWLTSDASFFTVTEGNLKTGIVRIEEAAVKKQVRAPTHWDIDFDKVRADLLDGLTEKSRELLRLPKKWRSVNPANLNRWLSEQADVYVGKAGPCPFGGGPAPLGYGTGIRLQTLDLMRIEPSATPKTLHEVIGMPERTAFRAYRAVKEFLAEVPARVVEKVERIKDATEKRLMANLKYFARFPKNLKARYTRAAEVLGELAEEVPERARRVLPVPGPKPVGKSAPRHQFKPPV